MTDARSTDAIAEAIEWFASFQNDHKRAIVPLLQERFGLNAAQACAVVRDVNLRRARAG